MLVRVILEGLLDVFRVRGFRLLLVGFGGGGG